MKIGFLSADWSVAVNEDTEERILIPGGSGWYRVHLPAMELAKHGHEVTVAEQVATTDDGLVLVDWITGEEKLCDVIVMQRIMNDFTYNLIECAHDNGQKVINDVDDWYWGLHPANNAYRSTDPKFNPECNRVHYKAALLASDLITVSTPFLYEKISEWGCSVTMVRNAIDLDRWEFHEQKEPPTVGWVGATSHRSGDLETLKGVVGPFVDRHDFKFHHSGWNRGFPHAVDLFGVDVNRSTSTPLCMIEQYPQQFKFFQIGLVPLNKIDFNEAKSCIKGLEYAASGIPFVAQDTSEYKWLRDEYGIGRVAKKPRDWIKNLEALVPLGVREEEAAINRKAVEAFDIKDRWVDWEEAYLSIT